MSKSFDREIYKLVEQEKMRQRTNLSLIASENIVSQNIRKVVGSELTNKYAEGYPGRRYYGGCENHDKVEMLAMSRAKELFGAQHANVQPHSGSNANMAAFFSVAELGDTILAMDLDHGGHLTHGCKVNFSGKFFNIVTYGVDPDSHLIDYKSVEKLALLHKPRILIAGASAYSREIDFERFAQIAKMSGAELIADMAHIAGLVAASLHPSPIPHARIVTTTTHKTLRGPRGGMILCSEEHAKAVDKWVFPGLQGGPLMHEIAGKAVCFGEALGKGFIDYQKQVLKNAKTLASVLSDSKIKLLTNGTDNHLVLADLTSLKMSGKEAEDMLGEIGIVVNKNKIPFDKRSATLTSGIRLGTPAITTRGIKEDYVRRVGEIIVDRLKKNASVSTLKQEVSMIADKFVIED